MGGGRAYLKIRAFYASPRKVKHSYQLCYQKHYNRSSTLTHSDDRTPAFHALFVHLLLDCAMIYDSLAENGCNWVTTH